MPVMVAIPRWLSGRAGRMSAYLLECLIEAHGHRALCGHFAKTIFWQNFAAAIGYRAAEARTLLNLLDRGVLPHDQVRLRLFIDTQAGQIGDVAGMRVFLPLPLACQNHAPARAANENLDALGFRLGAHRALSMEIWPGVLSRLSRLPILGPRTLCALSLLAEWLVDPSGEHPLELTFGDCSGTPSPLLLRVYDESLRTLEAMLVCKTTRMSRLGPLWMLEQRRRQLEPLAQPQEPLKWHRREQKISRNLLACGPRGPLEHDAEIPRLWKRRKIHIAPPPSQKTPPDQLPWLPDEGAALEDLFLP